MASSATLPPGSCLSDAQLAQVQAAPPGGAPEELARHLASCERCQARALFGADHRPSAMARPAPSVPTLGRAVLLALLLVGAMGFFFWTLMKLTGRVE
jgi:hypothetical protein